MKFPRPQSLSGLIFLGFALIALPLLLAVIRVSSQLNQLANESEALVIQGVQSTSESQQLGEQLAALERVARLYDITGRDDLVASYLDRHQRFLDTLDRVAALPAQQDAISDVRELRAGAEAVAQGLATMARDSDEFQALLLLFDDFNSRAARIERSGTRSIEKSLSSLRTDAQEAQRSLAWQTALLIPGTIFLIVLFTFLLARPIRQIDRAISALGQGAFAQPIEVSGTGDLHALGEQLEWLRGRLLEQAREKNKFLRHMSHELKTPLANIREGTELLMDGAVGELEESQREVAGILRENGVALQKLIENLLSFSAWQSKMGDLDVAQFEVNTLLKSVVEYQRLALSARGLKVRSKLEPVTLKADEKKMRMVFDNLLSNAVKFTPVGGTIYLRCSVARHVCIVDIADTGSGIPAAERTQIFEAFYQGSTPQGGHVRGTGIGLSVVYECVNAHGGTIEIVDGEYPGAHFRISLPLEPVAAVA